MQFNGSLFLIGSSTIICKFCCMYTYVAIHSTKQISNHTLQSGNQSLQIVHLIHKAAMIHTYDGSKYLYQFPGSKLTG